MTTIVVSGDYTVGEDQDLVFTGEPAFHLQGPASLTNLGSVSVLCEAGDVTGLDADAGQAISIRNAKGATYSVQGTDAAGTAVGMALAGAGEVINGGELRVRSAGAAVGVELDGAGALVVNERALIVSGRRLTSVGIEAADAATVDSSGRLQVNNKYHAIGIDLAQGGVVTNGGVLIAKGHFGAEGVVVHSGVLDFDNLGRMKLVAGEGHAASAVSILGGAAHITNAGTIIAADAIVEAAGADAAVTLDNSGRIEGLIDLGGGHDEVTNSWSITGDIWLGGGDDLYLTTGGGWQFGETHGGAGQDQLVGGHGQDQFFGEAGDDTLQGGGTGDFLAGGEGADVFVYGEALDSTTFFTDLILDLTAEDVIDVSAIDADTTVGGDQAFAIVAAFDGHAGEITLTYKADEHRTWIRFDDDGDGRTDTFIEVSGNHSGFANFVL